LIKYVKHEIQIRKIFIIKLNFSHYFGCLWVTRDFVHFFHFRKNFHTSQNFNFLPKVRFSNKIWIFEQNLDFWTKFRFLSKISIFEEDFDLKKKIQFLNKISIFEQDFDFWTIFRFLNKIWIFQQNFDFLTQSNYNF